MRNRWFPARIADYVPATQLKQLKAQDVDMARDVTFGVRLNLEEANEEESNLMQQPKYFVRPIEIEVLSVSYMVSFVANRPANRNNSLSGPWSSSTRSSHQRLTFTASLSSKTVQNENG